MIEAVTCPDCGAVTHVNPEKRQARAKLCVGCRAEVAPPTAKRNGEWGITMKLRRERTRRLFKRPDPAAEDLISMMPNFPTDAAIPVLARLSHTGRMLR